MPGGCCSPLGAFQLLPNGELWSLRSSEFLLSSPSLPPSLPSSLLSSLLLSYPQGWYSHFSHFKTSGGGPRNQAACLTSACITWGMTTASLTACCFLSRRAWWLSVSGLVISGNSPTSWLLLGEPVLQNPKALKTDGCWSVHLAQPAQPLLIIMAAGKGAPLGTSAENRWGVSDPEQSLGHKQVLLEKTNHLGSDAATSRGSPDVGSAELAVPTVPDKPRLGKPLPRQAHEEQRQSAFMDLPQLHERLGGGQAQEREHKDASGQPDPQQHNQDVPRAPAGGTVASVWPGTARGEQRSAFSKPTKRRAERPGPTSILQAGESADSLVELSGFLSTLDIPCWGRMSTSKLVVGDFWNLHTLSQNALLCSTFQGAPVLWLEHSQAQVPTSSTASRALLPPTITSLGFSTQNWCAKCSLSFRLTSDLVFHMRSHHKKEHVEPDLHSKKRREEALICPVCREYFRERHHLSRHMTSHS